MPFRMQPGQGTILFLLTISFLLPEAPANVGERGTLRSFVVPRPAASLALLCALEGCFLKPDEGLPLGRGHGFAVQESFAEMAPGLRFAAFGGLELPMGGSAVLGHTQSVVGETSRLSWSATWPARQLPEEVVSSGA
jgi:hypothetical protein